MLTERKVFSGSRASAIRGEAARHAMARRLLCSQDAGFAERREIKQTGARVQHDSAHE